MDTEVTEVLDRQVECAKHFVKKGVALINWEGVVERVHVCGFKDHREFIIPKNKRSERSLARFCQVEVRRRNGEHLQLPIDRVFEVRLKALGLKTFSEHFEQRARWLYGPTLLGQIIDHLKGKGLEVEVNPQNGNLNIGLPMPELLDELSGQMVPIHTVVPPELQEIFFERCDAIVRTRNDLLSKVNIHFMGRPVTQATCADLQSMFAEDELSRRARGKDELWQTAAEQFGLDWMVSAIEIESVRYSEKFGDQ
jgi:hypothetical protein